MFTKEQMIEFGKFYQQYDELSVEKAFEEWEIQQVQTKAQLKISIAALQTLSGELRSLPWEKAKDRLNNIIARLQREIV